MFVEKSDHPESSERLREAEMQERKENDLSSSLFTSSINLTVNLLLFVP